MNLVALLQIGFEFASVPVSNDSQLVCLASKNVKSLPENIPGS